MFETLEAKILGGLVAVLAVVGLAGAGYAVYEHIQAQGAEITQLEAQNKIEQAATAAAISAASATAAALDAKQAAQTTAATHTATTTTAVAAAVAASPDVAKTVVPESYWEAIYGGAKQ